MSFWDSSALGSLLLQEANALEIRSIYDQSETFVMWTLTPVEVVSALYQAARTNRISAEGLRQAEQWLKEAIESFNFVKDIEQVKHRAERILRIHPLKAADALQLAAALVYYDDKPQSQLLITLDTKLAQAGFKEGFTILPKI